jgi:hypothetical protein
MSSLRGSLITLEPKGENPFDNILVISPSIFIVPCYTALPILPPIDLINNSDYLVSSGGSLKGAFINIIIENSRTKGLIKTEPLSNIFRYIITL